MADTMALIGTAIVSGSSTFSITYNDNQYIAWHMPPTPFGARNVQFDPESTMYRDD
jgi:hypothetical protein